VLLNHVELTFPATCAKKNGAASKQAGLDRSPSMSIRPDIASTSLRLWQAKSAAKGEKPTIAWQYRLKSCPLSPSGHRSASPIVKRAGVIHYTPPVCTSLLRRTRQLERSSVCFQIECIWFSDSFSRCREPAPLARIGAPGANPTDGLGRHCAWRIFFDS